MTDFVDEQGLSATTIIQNWKNDAQLREEFNNDLSAYEAFMRAQAGGQVKIRGGEAPKNV